MDIWDSEFVDKHRRGISDIEWASSQPHGSPKYAIGDVMRFKAGGYGVVRGVQPPRNGWPSSYATDPVPGMADHPETKRAWHYELDFEACVAASPLHNMIAP